MKTVVRASTDMIWGNDTKGSDTYSIFCNGEENLAVIIPKEQASPAPMSTCSNLTMSMSGGAVTHSGLTYTQPLAYRRATAKVIVFMANTLAKKCH